MRYPTRGEVWLVDLGMAAKIRPCLVISARIGDADRALLCLVPHTTSTRRTDFEAVVGASFLKAGAFDAQGLVTLSPHHAIRQVGSLTQEQLRVVEGAICRWLELPCRQEENPSAAGNSTHR
ncbi:MAG TPA: type II toxin-antitoxin system PemK/MazF family toxin [Thermoanaerobaculia bacterium]|nr:type II toxin-antitoxin system PemK/MazF family toxin [Thermoanaerobaculia bacterium]